MSFAVLRIAALAAGALIVGLPSGAWAQDKASAQRTAQKSYDRAYQRVQADIAAGQAAIRACNFIAYEHAEDAYARDVHQAKLYLGGGANEEPNHPLPSEYAFPPHYPQDCTPPAPPSGGALVEHWNGSRWVAQPFVGVNVGGGFQNTSFAVDPPFNINSNGVIGGGFGGVLFPLPNTNVQLGFRVGGQGGNLVGDIKMPAASPAFTYKVTTNWTAYQEAAVRIDRLFGALDTTTGRQFYGDAGDFAIRYGPGGDYGLFVTGSLGIAESGTSVKGTSGMFSVTDNAVRTGFTFTAGVGMPVAVFPNGTVVDLFTQYRGTVWSSTVNIPGMVGIGSFTNEVDVGVTLQFPGLWEYVRH